MCCVHLFIGMMKSISSLQIQKIYMCEKMLTCWLCLNNYRIQTMWCVKWCWLADFKQRAYIFQLYDVWKAADLLTWLLLTNFHNHVVCERLLICWLCWNKTKNQTHVVCEMVLTCWLWIKNQKFPTTLFVKSRWLADFAEQKKKIRTMWCVKGCWLADFAETKEL